MTKKNLVDLLQPLADDVEIAIATWDDEEVFWLDIQGLDVSPERANEEKHALLITAKDAVMV